MRAWILDGFVLGRPTLKNGRPSGVRAGMVRNPGARTEALPDQDSENDETRRCFFGLDVFGRLFEQWSVKMLLVDKDIFSVSKPCCLSSGKVPLRAIPNISELCASTVRV